MKAIGIVAVDRVGLDLEGEIEPGVRHLAVGVGGHLNVRHGLAVGGVFQLKGEFLRFARHHRLDAEVGQRRVPEVLVALVGQMQLEVYLVVLVVLGDGRGAQRDVVDGLELILVYVVLILIG